MRTFATLAATVATSLLLLVTGLASTPASAADGGVEAQFVAAINEVRARAGLPALEVHQELVGVARGWADTMVGGNDIWHNPDLGSQVSAPWVLLGENVGRGYDVPTLMQAFVDSPAHYRNLVEPRFDWVGVGVTWSPDGRMYTAHVFMDLQGAPTSAPAPAAAPVAAAPAPAPAPVPAALPPAPAPPPAAAAPERVVAVLAAVAAVSADGVE